MKKFVEEAFALCNRLGAELQSEVVVDNRVYNDTAYCEEFGASPLGYNSSTETWTVRGVDPLSKRSFSISKEMEKRTISSSKKVEDHVSYHLVIFRPGEELPWASYWSLNLAKEKPWLEGFIEKYKKGGL